MQTSGTNISLKSYDDIFSTERERTSNAEEEVVKIPISELHSFDGHPFKVLDDDAMNETVESVKRMGIVNPLIVRPFEDGGYEIVSGHRRHHAAQLAGLETVPVLIREMDRDEAIIQMVDSNLQREQILPSEKAYAYQMKMDALKRKMGRPSKDQEKSDQVGQTFWAVNQVADDAGTSKSQVQRYVRLTNLIPELMDMVDEKKISFNPAVELSYLKPEEQKDFLEAYDYAQAAPSLTQAQRIKKMSQEGSCTVDNMCDVMDEVKKSDLKKISFLSDSLKKYFPKSYTPAQMEQTIIRLLEGWLRKRQRDMER